MSTKDRGSMLTVDFGAPEAFGAHHFRIEIPAAKTEAVRIIEDYGYDGGDAGRPYEEPRAVVDRRIWTAIGDAARSDFNERLKEKRQGAGRWRTPTTRVERLLGKELCVLAWAAEQTPEQNLPVVCSRWAALRPEERWWLFAMTAAEAGSPDDDDRGWRRALRAALQDGAHMTSDDRKRARRLTDRNEATPLLPGIR
jgi:hypothetical protein